MKVKKPSHIAIIMDGNGRWAAARGLTRTEGHRAGAEAVRRTVRAASDLKIAELTLFAFSTENWKRPTPEVRFLMNLLKEQLIAQRDEIMELNVRFSAIGRQNRLSKTVLRELNETARISAKNTGLHARLALDYGGRAEILDAANSIIQQIENGKKMPKRLTEKRFRQFLYEPGMSDPDLLIRTGGEMRISNFLLWQSSYSELYFTDVLWPDFDRGELEKAIAEYVRRDRRFGSV